jgi:hypothetical protein
MRPVAFDGIAAIVAENERLRNRLARLERLVADAEAHGSKVLDLYTIRTEVLG